MNTEKSGPVKTEIVLTRGSAPVTAKIESLNLPRSTQGSTDKSPSELLEDSSKNIERATFSAMNSLTESSKLLLAQMKSSVDPKTVIDSANALAGTVQVQVNIVKLAKQMGENK